MNKRIRACPKTLKKSAQSFHKFVIERRNSRRSVIYGFSNGFYRWNTPVEVSSILSFGTSSDMAPSSGAVNIFSHIF
nr:hypothetical protein [Leptospira borgpetersenii]